MADAYTTYRWKEVGTPPNVPAMAVYFREDAIKNENATRNSGIPTYDNVLFAVVAPMGLPKSNMTIEVERTLPDGTVIVNKQNSARFSEPLALYKKGVESEASGTPLKEIGLSAALIMNFKARGVHTVEMLSEMPDGAAQEMMGLYEYREKARTYVALRTQQAPIAKLEAQIEELRQALASKDRQFEDLAASIEKRGPGRPRKG